MSIKNRDLDRVFEKLQMEIRESGDRLAWLVVDGRRILSTKRSRGSKDMSGIAHLVRQQLKVNEDVFRGLIQCPVSRDDYIEILRGKGLLT